MKEYPSIPFWNKGTYGAKVHVFEKLDGTQLRVEWSKKAGFYKFGTSGQLINESDSLWGNAVTVFLNTYGDTLPALFKKYYREVPSVICYAEYYGYNSFIGNHDSKDEKHVALFEVNPYKKGFINPRDFVEQFQSVLSEAARYRGQFTYNKNLIDYVRNDMYSDNKPLISPIFDRQKTFEGVVCKWGRKTKGQDLIKMCKIKTNEWLDKVKATYGEHALLRELNNDSTLL